MRRAGVSAFGFGGTNFHAVLEEYVPGRHRATDAQPVVRAARRSRTDPRRRAVSHAPPARQGAAARRLVLGGADDADVVAQLERAGAPRRRPGVRPPPAAPDPALAGAAVRVAIDYADAADLAAKAARPSQALPRRQPRLWKMLRAQGSSAAAAPGAKVAFLYTGQGSQYVNMLQDLRDARADRRRDVRRGRPDHDAAARDGR